MATYASIQDIIDTLSVDDMKSRLDEYGVKYHWKSGDKKLAKLLLEKTGGSTLDAEGTTTKKVKTSSNDDWEKLAQSIKTTTSKIRASKGTRRRAYISKAFNFRLKPQGISKQGKTMRYVKGYKSLDIAEQREQGDSFPQEHIIFKGIEGTEFEMNGFIGRGILNTSDETLQEYIENTKKFGSQYVLFDKQAKERDELVVMKKKNMIESAIFNATENELICTLSFLNMRSGRNNFRDLYSISDKDKLTRKALAYAKNEPDLLLEATGSKEAKVIMLINLAREFNMIRVTSDEREIKLSDNGKTICTSSISSDWQNDLRDYLLQPQGQDLAKKMELVTGYTVF